MLKKVDYFWGEGQRDCDLALNAGFVGEIMPFVPAGGGLDLPAFFSASDTPPSLRKVILVKGYQYLFGRFFVALRALERAVDLLDSYKIVVINADTDSKVLCELFERQYGIKVEIISGFSDLEMIRLFASSRIYLGLSISDGLPASLLEALATGAFPIQSNTAITEGIVEDGVTGILVGPNDPDDVERALRKALSDDSLVDSAARLNHDLVSNKFDVCNLREAIYRSYNNAYVYGSSRRADA